VTAASSTRHARAVIAVASLFAVVAHVRLHREEVGARGRATLSPATRLRGWTHDVSLDGDRLLHALHLTFDGTLAEPVVLELARLPVALEAPRAIDHLGAPLALEVRARGEEAIWVLPAPPLAPAGQREVTLTFSTPAPPKTYGWGYRALPLSWAAAIAPPRIPAKVRVKVNETITARGFACSQEPSGRTCTVTPNPRRALALPIEPLSDRPARFACALALVATICSVLYALFRRWDELAAKLGLGERPRVVGEVDPFDTAALVARAIVAVLGTCASVFAVGDFEGGLLPFDAPALLAVWALCCAGIVVLAVGLDRPRAWLALGLTAGLAGLATLPTLRWLAPGLGALGATVAMQLTAPQR
jgi:hypothetical protein